MLSHAYTLAPAANDCDDEQHAERLPSEWRRRREAAASVARLTLRQRGVTVEACAAAWDDARSVAWGRLHGRRPLGAEHLLSLDGDDAAAVFEAWAAVARAA